MGDVECPERLNLVYGIPGEADVPSVQRFLRPLRRPEIKAHLFHFPPFGLPRFGVKSGYQEVLAFILSEKPDLVFHGHTEQQLEYRIADTRVISVGALDRGYYVVYDDKRNSYELSFTAIK